MARRSHDDGGEEEDRVVENQIRRMYDRTLQQGYNHLCFVDFDKASYYRKVCKALKIDSVVIAPALGEESEIDYGHATILVKGELKNEEKSRLIDTIEAEVGKNS